MSKCWIKDLNGALLPKKRKLHEAALEFQLHTQSTTKDYPLQLAKLTVTPLEENCPSPQGYKCGA
jgi:hypothetical protein